MPFPGEFYQSRGELARCVLPRFSGNPDISKSSVFILRDAPTAAVKKHKLKFLNK
jgi:hypothetical protein